jgi:riboflavin kinase/FMN adenylyltransferase
MQHYWSIEDIHLQDSWVTIGSFDGVHLGHQEIVRNLVHGARKANVPSVVVTFYPHPAYVLGKRNNPIYLTLPEERADLLGQMGVDMVISYPFNLQVASLTAKEFMLRLKKHLGLSHLCIGYDFALGRGREGNIDTLKVLGEELGYEVTAISAVVNGEGVVSSSRIRNLLLDGEVERAARLIGRPYRLSGEVIRGDARGKALGIPTANMDIWAERAVPKAGVYVCKGIVDGDYWGAVTNIGVRPTFEKQPVLSRVEAHLLDFEGDLYGKTLQLDFISRLRDEQHFNGIQALVDQIHKDIGQARRILNHL